MKRKSSRKRAWIGAAAVIIIIAALAINANPIQSAISGYFVKKNPQEVNIQTLVDTSGREFRSERGDWFDGLSVEVSCEDYNKIAAKTNGRYTDQCLGKAQVLYTDYMVKELPQMPKDFFLYTQALFEDPISKRIPYDPEKFGEEYWLQPEWVITFEEQKVGRIMDFINDPRYGVVWGVGTWDDKLIRITKPPIADEDIVTNVYAWIEAVPTTQGYLGVGLRKTYPSVAEFAQNVGLDAEPNRKYYQSPSIAEQYIDLKIDREEVLLEPNFPYFYPGYRIMLNLTLTIKKDTPQGIYLIGVQPDRPSREFSDSHRLADPENYWDPYLGFARIGEPYQIFIEVNT